MRAVAVQLKVCSRSFGCLVKKLANAIVPAVLGFILARAGWQETTGEVVAQSSGALNALQVSITLMPAAILLLAGVGLVAVYHPMAKRVLG